MGSLPINDQCYPNQLTGFYMLGNADRQWVKLLFSVLFVAFNPLAPYVHEKIKHP